MKILLWGIAILIMVALAIAIVFGAWSFFTWLLITFLHSIDVQASWWPTFGLVAFINLMLASIRFQLQRIAKNA